MAKTSASRSDTTPRPAPTVGHAAKIRLAAKARVSLPTVDKALRGDAIRGDAGTRIHEVLAAEGLTADRQSTPPSSSAA